MVGPRLLHTASSAVKPVSSTRPGRARSVAWTGSRRWIAARPKPQRERAEVVARVGALRHQAAAHEARQIAVRAAGVQVGLRASELLQRQRTAGPLENLEQANAGIDRLECVLSKEQSAKSKALVRHFKPGSFLV